MINHNQSFKLIKNYKNLENHRLKSRLVKFERLETKCILFKLYPKNCNLENNYCPILQEHWSLKFFLQEDLLTSNFEDLIRDNLFFEQRIGLNLKNFTAVFPELYSEKYVRLFYLNWLNNQLRKFYIKLEKEFFFYFTKRIKILLNKLNLKRKILDFNFKQAILIKKFLKFLKFYLKRFVLRNGKNKFFYSHVLKANFGGFILQNIGFKKLFFYPFSFSFKKKLNNKMRWSLGFAYKAPFLIQIQSIKKDTSKRLGIVIRMKSKKSI
jgi:hypothetical protein